MQQNNWCKLGGDRDETINHIINESCKLAQKSIRLDTTGLVISVLGTVTEGLVQKLEDLEKRGQGETIQTEALLRSDRILRRILETCRHLLLLKQLCESTR